MAVTLCTYRCSGQACGVVVVVVVVVPAEAVIAVNIISCSKEHDNI